MKRNKGFTLVELLAVIVILAVIALIATPTVLSMIEEARQGAAKSSMQAYVKGMETAVISAMMEDDTVYDGTYTITGDKANRPAAEGKKAIDLDLEMKNDQPDKDATNTMTVADGNVTDAQLTFGAYAVVYKFNASTGSSKICVQKSTDGYDTTCTAS